MKQSIMHTVTSEFFNQYCKEELKELYNHFGEQQENNLFPYKKYVITGRYRQDEFYIADLKNPIEYKELEKLPKDSPRPLIYSHELCNLSGKVFECERYVYVSDIIQAINDMDSKLGHKLLDIYHNFCANSVEVDRYADNIFEIQKVMQKYLKENDLYKNSVEITYNPEDPESVTQWFQAVHREKFKELPQYNDLDYTPFLIIGNDKKEYYMIEDVSSDKLFIYSSKNENSGSWYKVSRNDFKNCADDMHDALYDSNQYLLKNIDENLNEFSLIAQYEDGKIVKATNGIDHLSLLQTYIYGQLNVEGKVSLDIDDSFAYMLANYRVDTDYHQHDIDEIRFFPFLKAIKENPGSLYYHNYVFHKSHENTPNLNDIAARTARELTHEKMDYGHLKQLSPKHQSEILNFITEKMEKFSSISLVEKHLNEIKTVLSSENIDSNEVSNAKFPLKGKPINTLKV
jgi:hypothetical protein